ncbi:hypothetical protein AHAS_Ahas14G0104100 [Arachis hypogaea]
MLEARFRGMMRSHREIKMGDLHRINTMRSSGLRVLTIFWAFSIEVVDSRWLGLRVVTPVCFGSIHCCDGASQYDFNVLGDVMGFDATYGRNKYKCPLVIFSGVDHHMCTAVFGCTVLSKEGGGKLCVVASGISGGHEKKGSKVRYYRR